MMLSSIANINLTAFFVGHLLTGQPMYKERDLLHNQTSITFLIILKYS
jgi:hypothetical protein